MPTKRFSTMSMRPMPCWRASLLRYMNSSTESVFSVRGESGAFRAAALSAGRAVGAWAAPGPGFRAGQGQEQTGQVEEVDDLGRAAVLEEDALSWRRNPTSEVRVSPGQRQTRAGRKRARLTIRSAGMSTFSGFTVSLYMSSCGATFGFWYQDRRCA